MTILLLSHWKFLVICALISLLAGFGITKAIPKEYLSYAEVYANVSNSIDDAVNKPEFGYEIHADRLIQLFESQDIKDSVIQQFSLYNYYDLDTSDLDQKYKIYNKLSEDLTFTRNPKMAIIVSAQTRDPELSADIVNYVIELVDRVQQRILKLNTQKAVAFYAKEHGHQKNTVDSLMNKIYDIQVDTTLEDPLISSRRIRLMNTIKDPENPLRNQLEYLSLMPITLEDEKTINNYVFELEQLKIVRTKLTNAQNQLKAPMASINIISRAKPIHESQYPSMITNLLLSLSLGVILAILIIIGKAKFQEIKRIRD